MKKRDTESMRSRVQALTADLERQAQELFDSDRYREFLDAMAKFHHYSLNNSLLILMQRPDAEQVASFATWKKLGRQVKTGEKGIRILVPVPVRGKKEKLKDGRNADTDGIKSIEGEDEKCSRLFFKIGHVWDIAQTEGAPLPSLAVSELEGNVADFFLVDSRRTGLIGAQKDFAGAPAAIGIREPVDITVVNGRVVVRDGHLTGMDEAVLSEKANQAFEKYISR